MSRRAVRAARRPGRLAAALVAAALLVSTAACGFDAQTLKPYTPSEGVNINIGTAADGEVDTGTVQVRNLMVLSRTSGEGFLSASLLTQGSDSLTGVSGTVVNTDGSTGSTLTASVPSPVELSSNNLVVLTDQTEIAVTGAGLNAGQTVNLTLTFAKAGSQQTLVPIVDANFSPYNSVSPSPAPSSATPSS